MIKQERDKLIERIKRTSMTATQAHLSNMGDIDIIPVHYVIKLLNGDYGSLPKDVKK